MLDPWMILIVVRAARTQVLAPIFNEPEIIELAWPFAMGATSAHLENIGQLFQAEHDRLAED